MTTPALKALIERWRVIGRSAPSVRSDFLHCANELEAVLSTEPQASAWQPIATAPKDMVIDLWAKQRFAHCVWHADWREWAQRGYIVHSPTHWMPLPAPPVPAVTKETTQP